LLLGAVGAVASLLAPMVGHAQETPLRPLADSAGVMLGAAVDPGALGDADYRSLLVDHVNLISTRGDLSMAAVQPEPGVFDFSQAEAIVDFAVENDLPVRGHELIGGPVPVWVSTGSWTPDTLAEVLRDHVTAVVGHFRDRNPGVITQWDVVGDAVMPDGSLRPTIWQQVIGDDYVSIAFEAANDADPDATLFYDDFYDDLAVTQDAVAAGVAIVPGANAERSTCDAVPKCIGIRDRVTALVTAGTPIDGVGFQSHLFSPDPADLAQLSAWVGDAGLQWAVTEFDVPLPVTEVANPETLQFQAEVYAAALAACVDAPECDTFVTWGITDRVSTVAAETDGVFDGALWFDANDAAKPAFDAMAQVLAQRATPTTTTVAPTTQVAPTTAAEQDVTDDSTGAGIAVPIVVGFAVLATTAAVIVASRRRRAPFHAAKNP
jgi:endo-1,4-beta-xylanase